MAYGRILYSVAYLLTGIGTLFQSEGALAQVNTVQRPIVLELFTSQGCSSCPPADTLLGELARDTTLLPLSFHVDYWDRLGWKDPFSHVNFTNRQSLYNQALRTPGNYTPQMVVDGSFETVGSYYTVIHDLIDAAKTNASYIPISLTLEDNGMVISVPGGTALTPQANIWLIGYDSQKNTYIDGGENRGRQLSSYNVVRYLEHIGTYDGKPIKLHIQFHWQEPTDNIAIILQEIPIGKILGAINKPLQLLNQR